MKPAAPPIPDFFGRHRQLLENGGGPLDTLGFRGDLNFHPGTCRDLENAFLGRLREEIERLLPQDREVFLLCVAARLRYEEIASALSLPVETVKQRVARAREQLRSGLFIACAAFEPPAAPRWKKRAPDPSGGPT